MEHHIPFAEGSYLVERAHLVTPSQKAVSLRDTTLEVFQDETGNRQLHGKGFVQNVLLVQLLEDEERFDLLLDLGEGFKYLLENPVLHSGKMFQPNTESILRFSPGETLRPLTEDQYRHRLSGLLVK